MLNCDDDVIGKNTASMHSSEVFVQKKVSSDLLYACNDNKYIVLSKKLEI
jgi:hypothetical protein